MDLRYLCSVRNTISQSVGDVSRKGAVRQIERRRVLVSSGVNAFDVGTVSFQDMWYRELFPGLCQLCLLLPLGSIAFTCGTLWKISNDRCADFLALDCAASPLIPEQDVAAACIFLATKTEECGRKLRDVARVFAAKLGNKEMSEVAMESKELEQIQNAILATEEVLLETLCFEFWVESPHSHLIDLLEVYASPELQDYAWSIAHDSFRTPLCILYSARVIAAACFILAQKYQEGPNAVSLDARISIPAPSSTLPTPPPHNPTSPDPSSDRTRFVANFMALTEDELRSVADTLSIMLEYYCAQDAAPQVAQLCSIQPPTINPPRAKLYRPFNQFHVIKDSQNNTLTPANSSNQTPNSSHGGSTPAQKLPLDLS